MSTSTTNAPRLTPPTEAEVRALLDYDMAELVRRRDLDILPALSRLAKPDPETGHPFIADGDEDTAARYTDQIKMAKALVGSANTQFKVHKEPWLTAGRVVDGWFRAFGDKIAQALIEPERALLGFQQRKAAAEQRRQQAEAARRAAEAEAAQEAAARAMAAQHPDAGEHLERAAEAAAAADAAEAAATAKPADRSRVRGVHGATSSIRTVWRWELEDIAKVPAHFLTVDEDAVKAAVAVGGRDRATGRPLAVIPGIRWVADEKLTVR